MSLTKGSVESTGLSELQLLQAYFEFLAEESPNEMSAESHAAILDRVLTQPDALLTEILLDLWTQPECRDIAESELRNLVTRARSAGVSEEFVGEHVRAQSRRFATGEGPRLDSLLSEIG